LVLLLILVSGYFGYRWIERRSLEEDFNRQAESIANALVAVNELTGYLQGQQAEVKDRNRIIAGLKEEEGRIRPPSTG
jgi:hypothetical protein